MKYYALDIKLATKFGVEEAVMIENLDKKHLYSVAELKKLYPFWSEKQIRRILKSLVEKGVLTEKKKS